MNLTSVSPTPHHHGSRNGARRHLALVAGIAGLALAGSSLVATPAQAITLAPNYIEHPAGAVTADALPTTQIDGIAWTQKVVGNTVYVGGEFANARPAGAAPGTQQSPRANLLAYDLATGTLKGFRADTNGAVKTLAVSPDGSTLYLGGSFTTVAGKPRHNIAAIDLASGELVANFAPDVNSEVDAIAVSASTVHYGGLFTTVDGQARTRLAATQVATGTLTSWAPVADLYVKAMTFTPDGSKLALGGSFATINGAAAPGLAFVDPTSGTLLPFAANKVVQNYGSAAGIYSLKNDGQNLLATGWWYGDGGVNAGNFEGVLSASPSDGSIRWMADCHGDSYDATTLGGYTYSVSHHHTCANFGSFPEQTPQYQEHAQAFTDKATTTVTQKTGADYYASFIGQPAPSQVDWFPEFGVGTASGQNQAAWSIESSGDYVVVGGEFPTVNNAAQQGLVRFALPGTAPSESGPIHSGDDWPLSTQVLGTTARISWPANVDRDNMKLTYRLYRADRPDSPLWTGDEDSAWFERPTMGQLDQGLVAGTSYTYWVTATDPDGNVAQSAKATIVAGQQAVASTPYSQDVAADGAAHYWRLLEAAGSTRSIDWASDNDLQLGTGVTLGQGGATGDGAAAFDGTSNGRAASTNPETAPKSFSAELWFKTTSTTGGKLLGFGDQATGDSLSYDRQVYLDDTGHLHFGVNDGGPKVVSSPAGYNDGTWHHVVATLGSSGTALWVDGREVADDPTATAASAQVGHWRLGGDTLSGWPDHPTSNDVAATLDDVAIYPTVLGQDQVRKHYTDSGRSTATPSAPSDTYGGQVFGDGPSLYYRLDETGGTLAADATGIDDGSYQGDVAHVTSPVTGADGHGASFAADGSNVVAGLVTKAPATSSEEAWFSTTSSAGGSIMGFGLGSADQAQQADRQLWMGADGKLDLRLAGTPELVLTSPKAYNDGHWHHVVATVGTGGTTLYVDGVAAAHSATATAQVPLGRWYVGGGPAPITHTALDGTLDEVAVYPRELSLQQVRSHYRASAVGVDQAPTAGFTSTCTGGACSFDAAASTDADGTVGSWAWDFGDGTSGSGVTAKHSYAHDGVYAVRLTVTDDQGKATTVTRQVTVTGVAAAPTAVIDSSCTALACTFDSTGSTAPGSSITAATWSFGDGTTATGATVRHVYPKPGSYTVTLTVTTAAGQGATATRTVTVVANQPPTAAFTSQVTDLTARFDASASRDADGTVADYAWTFGDGSTGTGVTPTHTYAKAGTYTVTLVVTDDKGAKATRTARVVVSAPANKPPVADFDLVLTGRSATLDGRSSSDPDGRITGYRWDFGDGQTATGATVKHTWRTPGSYTVRLTVTDDRGATSSTTRTVRVPAAKNKAPKASFTHAESGLTTTLDASASRDADGAIATYRWDFGDGSVGRGRTVQHTYTAAGRYTVTLTVTDDAGAKATASAKLRVSTPPQAVRAAADFSGRTTAAWPSAAKGGQWVLGGAARDFSDRQGTGLVQLRPGATGTASLGRVSSRDAALQADISFARLANGAQVELRQRQVGSSSYGLAVRQGRGGSIELALLRHEGGRQAVLARQVLGGVSYRPGEVLHVRFAVAGSGSTRLTGTLWTGSAAPATPQVAATDHTAELQEAGSIGLATSLPAHVAPVLVGVDNLLLVAG